MPKATLTKRLEFCASHRYHNPKWTAEKNREVFGACNNVNTHGHNYLLEVTLQGDIDPVTGMIINLYDLKIILNQILEQFDHKNLNLDTPFFSHKIPTTENLVLTLFDVLQGHPELPRLDRLRLYEDDSLYAVVTAEDWEDRKTKGSVPTASIARRYLFSAVHSSGQGPQKGHNYCLWVSLKGPVDEETGQVISLTRLDQIVHDHLLAQWDQQELSEHPMLVKTLITDSSLADVAWKILEPKCAHPPLSSISISRQENTLAAVTR